MPSAEGLLELPCVENSEVERSEDCSCIQHRGETAVLPDLQRSWRWMRSELVVGIFIFTGCMATQIRAMSKIHLNRQPTQLSQTWQRMLQKRHVIQTKGIIRIDAFRRDGETEGR